MFIMRLVLGNLLLFLALGPRFKSIDAQETTTEMDENITVTLPNKNIVTPTLSSEIPSTTSENTATQLLQTEVYPHNPEITLVNEINTMSEEPTGESTPPPSTEIEQTSLESVPETIPVQTEQTAVTTYTAETTVTEKITLGAPSTVQYETTVGFTSPESTSPTESPPDEITSAEAMTTVSPTSILTTPPADWTESLSIKSMLDPVDTSTETSTTTTSTSTPQLPQNTADYPESESVSTHFTTPIGVIIEGSSQPFKNNWLIIIIVVVAVIFALCVGAILFAQRRKKNASRNFSPMYMNGQSKRSKKKKGAEDDAWAGPVKLEAGLECDAEVQEGLLHNNGKQDGDDMVLSTFAALDAEPESNGGVGGDGTKEAKKWEEQEPLLYIDEDVNEGKTGTTPEESEGRKGDEEKSEEKGMNGGETFCLTTAV